LIPMLYVMVGKVIGEAKPVPVPATAPGATLATEHGQGSH